MIGKGIVITAAHCIADWGKGKAGFAKNVYFIPGATSRNNSSFAGPVGRWKSKELIVPTCYLNGTCANTGGGVLSSNDIGIIVLGGNRSALPNTKGELLRLWLERLWICKRIPIGQAPNPWHISLSLDIPGLLEIHPAIGVER